ncbi:MAG: NAD(+)/NADH kinase [Nitrospinae bacterium]|nr:NAD(+)/NADH kinase [Nitrospinota bacterium]
MKKIGVIAKSHKLERVDSVKRLYNWLVEKDLKVFLDCKTGERIGVPSELTKEDVGAKDLDLLIVLGGDGTLLSVARMMYGRGVPILGVNMGSLGFLTEVTMDEIYPTLESVLAGKIDFEERILLSVTVLKKGEVRESHTVMNDVVFNKGVLSRIVDLKVSINGQYVSSYRGDGLIIATPTGSTAYSMAAGGPILYPTIDALIICPICPFSFANRPIVIPGNREIEVRLEVEHKDFYVTLDGQVGFEMNFDDAIHIRRADSRLKLIHLPEKNYYEVLRKKLKWGER